MSDEDEIYTVEKIVDQKTENGKVLYRVRWENYPPDQDTWEPYANVQNCQEALEEYRAECRKKNTVPKKPSDYGLPDSSDSDDYVSGDDENSRISHTKKLTTTSEEELRNSPAVKKAAKLKKFKRISKLLISSDSDDEAISFSAQNEKSSVVKTNVANENLKGEPLASTSSSSQKHGKVTIEPKIVDLQSKNAKKESRNSAGDSNVGQLTNSAQGPKSIDVQKKKKDKMKVKTVDGNDAINKSKPKLVQKAGRSGSFGDDVSSMGGNELIKKSKPKSVQKTERSGSFGDDVISMGGNDAINKSKQKLVQKTGRSGSFGDDVSSMGGNLGICKPKPVQNTGKSSSDPIPKPVQNTGKSSSDPIPKPVQNTGKSSSDSIPKPVHKPKTVKNKKLDLHSMDCEPGISGSTEACENSPKEFLKNFNIPKLTQKANDVNAKKEKLSSGPATVPEKKPPVNHSSSTEMQQKKHLSSKTNTSRKASETVTSGASSSRIHEPPKMAKKQLAHKVGAISSVSEAMPSTSTQDPSSLSVGFGELSVSHQPLKGLIDEPMDIFQGLPGELQKFCQDNDFPDQINWTPPAENEQRYSQNLDKTSNASGSKNVVDFPVLNYGPKTANQKNAQPPPPSAEPQSKTKMRSAANIEVPREVIETMHQYVKHGNYDQIFKYYNQPGKHDWELVNPRGSTILMQAAVNGKKEIVEFLLLHGADINARQANGKSVLMIVSDNGDSCKETRRLEILKILLTFGAKLNFVDSHGETALMMACKRGCIDIVTFLLEHGADFYIKSTLSRTSTKRRTAKDFAIDCINEDISRGPRIVNIITQLELKVTAAFEAQIQLVLNKTAELLNPLFDTRIFNLNEDTKFALSFDYEEQEFMSSEGLILFVGHALISLNGEVMCRMYGDTSSVSRIELNGVRLIGITQEDHVLSFCPVNKGKNNLEIFTRDMKNSDIKLILRAYKVKVI